VWLTYGLALLLLLAGSVLGVVLASGLWLGRLKSQLHVIYLELSAVASVVCESVDVATDDDRTGNDDDYRWDWAAESERHGQLSASYVADDRVVGGDTRSPADRPQGVSW